VAGTYFSNFGFLYENGTFTTVDPRTVFTPPSLLSTTAAGGFLSHGFVYDDGAFTTFDGPNAISINVAAINDHGVVAGTYEGLSSGQYRRTRQVPQIRTSRPRCRSAQLQSRVVLKRLCRP
jgi:hypothetical protein